jgi:saccharopine dehydrogenase-like NADP-dependent oxidoreductase
VKYGKKKRMICDVLIERDLKTGLFAMSLGVGYAASIAAQMIGKGEIQKRGILSPVTDIPYDAFMMGLMNRGIKIEEKIETE